MENIAAIISDLRLNTQDKSRRDSTVQLTKESHFTLDTDEAEPTKEKPRIKPEGKPDTKVFSQKAEGSRDAETSSRKADEELETTEIPRKTEGKTDIQAKPRKAEDNAETKDIPHLDPEEEIAEDNDPDPSALESIIEQWNGTSGALSSPTRKADRTAWVAAYQQIDAENSDGEVAEEPVVTLKDVIGHDEGMDEPEMSRDTTAHAWHSACQLPKGTGTEPAALNLAQAGEAQSMVDQTALTTDSDGRIELEVALEAATQLRGRDHGLVQGTGFSAPNRPAPGQMQTIIRQIVDASITVSDEQVEITLSPEELGRVRLILSGREHAPHLAIWAERPEILDQLRRNAASLLQNFVDAGLENATFEFRDEGFEQQENLPDWGASQTSVIEIEAPAHIAQQSLSGGGWTPLGSRIDIRI